MVETEDQVSREIGHALTVPVGGTSEDNWELRFPQSAGVFAKMGREDSQVTSVLNAVTLPIKRASWRLDPNGADQEIVALVSDDLRLPILGDDSNKPIGRRRGRVSWGEHLQQALLALQFGYSFFEQVYAPGDDGREHLVKLAPRRPGSIRQVNVARDGGLKSIEQSAVTNTSGESAKGATIPVDRLVAYIHDPKDSTWTGSSVLRPAYKHWKLRDRFLRLEADVLDRNGMGVPVYVGSELTNDPKSDLAYGQELAKSLRSGAGAGASVPAKAELKLLGVSGQLVSPREAIAYHDSMMAKAVLAHFLNLDGGGGSYALAETQSDLFIQSLQTIADWVADTATQHIVEDLVDVAFPEWDGPCPRIVLDPIASKKELSAESLATLVRDGMILPDRDLEEEVRRRYSLPAKRPLNEAIADGDAAPQPDTADGMDPDLLATLATTVKTLIDAGVPREEAMQLVGLHDLTEDPGEPPGEEVMVDE